MTVEMMQNTIITVLGFENPYTIDFFALCEKGFTRAELENVMHIFIKQAYEDMEEE